MASSNNGWIWSEEHQDYYMYWLDANGQPTYHWAKQSQSSTAAPLNRHDSVTYPSYAQTPAQTPAQTRAQNEYISGTAGRRERLHPSYFVREGSECQRFFRKGRVFSMLWSEPAGAQANASTANNAYTVVQFNEGVYSQIRRFVVVAVPNDKGFVYACGISTYSGRGVLKEGCTPEDHSPVYFKGATPYWTQEEANAGMTNEPIEVEPAEQNSTMHWASRINFGKTVAVEKNVKVKDLGRLKPEHMSNLLKFWKAAKGDEDEG